MNTDGQYILIKAHIRKYFSTNNIYGYTKIKFRTWLEPDDKYIMIVIKNKTLKRYTLTKEYKIDGDYYCFNGASAKYQVSSTKVFNINDIYWEKRNKIINELLA
jgi:hypothetical protein